MIHRKTEYDFEQEEQQYDEKEFWDVIKEHEQSAKTNACKNSGDCSLRRMFDESIYDKS